MILGTEVFAVLKKESVFHERSISSHWIEYLRDFNYEKGSFSKGLGDGRGGEINKFKTLVNYILQTPFRRQGAKFSKFNEILQHAYEIHKERRTSLRLGTLQHVLSLALIEEEINLDQIKDPILVIGDGFGIMTSLLLSYLPNFKSKFVCINLNKNLLIDAFFIKESVHFSNICLVKNSLDYHKALKDSEVNVICLQADNAHLISGGAIGLAINISSMQEMNPPIIAQYFNFIRNSPNQNSYFYCSNRLEKILFDGTIVNYFKYPWDPKDQFIVDELCPWHQYYYTPKKLPFYFPFNGAVQHRLVLMNKTSQN